MTVVLNAAAPCWITGTADGKRVLYRALQPGERVSLEGKRTISIRAGNAGALTWTVDGTTTEVGPGEALFITRGVVHHFDNRSDEDASALAIVTPGILGPDFFREVAEVVNAGGPPDLAALGAVMRRHGLTPAS